MSRRLVRELMRSDEGGYPGQATAHVGTEFVYREARQIDGIIAEISTKRVSPRS